MLGEEVVQASLFSRLYVAARWLGRDLQTSAFSFLYDLFSL
jgi:hypothetical protein